MRLDKKEIEKILKEARLNLKYQENHAIYSESTKKLVEVCESYIEFLDD